MCTSRSVDRLTQSQVYRWVMHQIRSSADDRRRAKMTKQLVKVAQECHKITDMNTCYAVCSALKGNPRLHTDAESHLRRPYQRWCLI